MQHTGGDGWVALAKKEAGRFQQYHYKVEEATAALSDWLGEDVYFSQNSFYKPSRKVEDIRSLRALYVDLDFYLLNYDIDWIIGKMEAELFKTELPDPNLILHSGRGICVIWLIDPVPYQALPLWQSIENHFVKKLKNIGADQKVTDSARILRLAGTVNSKNGETVSADVRHSYRYTLREIQRDYLPELKPKSKKKKRGRPPKIQHLYNVHSLHHARLLDLNQLVAVRRGEMTNYRELACFLYRYWNCCFLSDPQAALDQTLEFNAGFTLPLAENEVTRATKTAEKAYFARNDEEANKLAQEKGYPAAGYNLRNSKIIEWLEITEKEQRALKSIISGNEKRRRKRKRDRERIHLKRRQQGVLPREDYLQQQADKTADKLFLLEKALDLRPDANRAELAAMLDVTKQRITQLKNLLRG